MDYTGKREKVLIISYVFPPYPGIGGRRWAKFAKYFSREGMDVHVICAKNPYQNLSVWIDDVMRDQHIHIHPVQSFYPAVLDTEPKKIWKKIEYRFWELLQAVLFKGYIYDKVIYSADAFLQKADEIIREQGIEKIIVTGAPFRLVHIIACNRHKWGNVHITTDFRDPWTWEGSGPFQRLNKSRLEYEKNMEAEVVASSDLISVPTLPMKIFLERTYPHSKGKLTVLPHAWDEDEITPRRKDHKPGKLIMFGTMYPGIENSIRELAAAMTECNCGITLDIYSDSNRYSEIFKEENAAHLVNYYPMIPSRQLYARMHRYTAAVIINNESDKDHVATKFIELAASETPVIYMAEKGQASAFVEKFNTGWHIKNQELPELFQFLMSDQYKAPVSVMNRDYLSYRNVSRAFLSRAYNMEIPRLAEIA
jgi:glycosyltransferase involved in cell wall biosynthesis